ncbi:hypothetical protein [uncultured Ferrimonas sp.]|uniref:hypothetical protein n=1 Tax=uncultured Ferrimonas sp. TaxID=432640 RepID=UPI00260AD2AD|nr:hypothetical protein [uncultured Ferrimonas sp.]
MSMKSAKEFAVWMIDRFGDQQQGVYLQRADIKELSGRQTIRQDFIADIHAELTRHGMGFVTDSIKENYYLFYLPQQYWKQVADRYASKPASNIHTIEASKLTRRGR